jgi:hypothetical protein
MSKPKRHTVYPSLFVVMHDGADGPIPSGDLPFGPVFNTLDGAKRAICKRWKRPQRDTYYVVEFEAKT